MTIKNYIPNLTQKDLDRFWSKVALTENPNLCWEWQRGKNIGGYGTFDLRGKTFFAHRVAYFIYYGIDPKELHTLHKCDNPSCVQKSHLFLGTDKDNVHDMVAKGRMSIRAGEVNNKSKLKEWQVSEIRKRYSIENISLEALATEYGVTSSCTYSIINKRTWKHIDLDYKKDDGIEYSNGKLNSIQVLEIRDKSKNSEMSISDLAKLYSVTNVSIYNVINGRTWKHLQNKKAEA